MMMQRDYLQKIENKDVSEFAAFTESKIPKVLQDMLAQKNPAKTKAKLDAKIVEAIMLKMDIDDNLNND